MTLDSEPLKYLSELACLRVNLAFDSLGIFLEELEKKQCTTESRRQCLNIFLNLLNVVDLLPLDARQAFRHILIEGLPELKECYSPYPDELKLLTKQVIHRVETMIEKESD